MNPFYYGAGFGSGFATVTGTVTNYSPVPLRQKVTIPSVPVPQHCQNISDILSHVWPGTFSTRQIKHFTCCHVVRMAQFLTTSQA